MTLLKPHATCFSENDLLVEAARMSTDRLGFFHAEALYGDAVGKAKGPGRTDLAKQATNIMCNHLIGDIELPSDRYKRLQRLIVSKARAYFDRAVRDLAAVKQIQNFPDSIWTASGGRWPGRVLSIEAMRRGCRIVRFDHSGGRGIHRFPAWAAVLDMYCSSVLNLATEPLVGHLKGQGVHELLPKDRQCQLRGRNGEPKFKQLDTSRLKQSGERRRVVYASGKLRGLLQTVPAQLPDVVYLDWQMRIVEQLKKLPIDLVCKPHPEGIQAGQPHPLSSVGDVRSGRFEDLIPEADIFVMDVPHSTTFFEALCTDRPIVFMDFGTPFFDPKVRPAIERRCRVIETELDEHNRPIVDFKELEDAICGGSDYADPTEFRELFVGNAG